MLGRARMGSCWSVRGGKSLDANIQAKQDRCAAQRRHRYLYETAREKRRRQEGHMATHSYGHANIAHSPHVYLSHLFCLFLAAAAASC